MKAFPAILLGLLWLHPALAVDRADPSGDYGLHLSLLVAGDRAVAFYWGEHMNAADRSCECQWSFQKRGEGRWGSTTDVKATLRLDEAGFEVQDDEMECCGSGVGAPSAKYSEGRLETCQVTGKSVPQLKPGTMVPAITAPAWASLDESPSDAESGPKHLVRARVGAVERILLVPDSELSCKAAKAAASRPSFAQAHASALALYKSGEAREAAQALGQAAGPKPWTISKEDLTAFNDWGFFLQESKQYPEAIEVLSAVLAAFPDRTPAYLNQGDAYAGLGDMAKAKAAYRHYADLMKKAGLDRKVPDRVKKALQD